MNEVTREKLSADFKAVIGDVDELVKATSQQAGEKIVDLRERLGKKIEDGRKALSEQGRVRVQEARASAEAYLREKRLASLAIAAGVGLVLGLLLGRRE